MENKFEIKYKNILKEILEKGIEREDRTGIGSFSLFAKSLSFDLSSNNFPLITGKKIFHKNYGTEFIWFMNGETNIKRFKENNVHIWDNWADNKGNLGPVYGYQMINFNGQNYNQLQKVISSIRKNPDSRRHIISLWNPIQLNEMRLPPCYLYFQFFVNKKDKELNLFVVQRSADMFIGIPYDLALFSLLLYEIAKQTNLKPKLLKVEMVDVHIYKNQISQVKEYLQKSIHNLPKIKYNSINDFEIINYKSEKFIKTNIAI